MIANKASMGKLIVPDDVVAPLELIGLEQLDFGCHDALLLVTHPFHHRAPFDRMLVAQVLHHSLALRTDDAKLEAYGCKIIRASLDQAALTLSSDGLYFE